MNKYYQKFGAKYYRQKYRTFAVRFHKEKDKDVIDTIDGQPNKINYFRRIIIEDIRRHRKGKNS